DRHRADLRWRRGLVDPSGIPGLVVAGGRRFVAYGRPAHGGPRPRDDRADAPPGRPVQHARRPHPPLRAEAARRHAAGADDRRCAAVGVLVRERDSSGVVFGSGRRAGPRPSDHPHELMQTAADTATTAAWEWPATGTTWRIHHTG